MIEGGDLAENLSTFADSVQRAIEVYSAPGPKHREFSGTTIECCKICILPLNRSIAVYDKAMDTKGLQEHQGIFTASQYQIHFAYQAAREKAEISGDIPVLISGMIPDAPNPIRSHEIGAMVIDQVWIPKPKVKWRVDGINEDLFMALFQPQQAVQFYEEIHKSVFEKLVERYIRK